MYVAFLQHVFIAMQYIDNIFSTLPGVHSWAVSGERLADPVCGPVRSLLWMSIRILLFAITVRLRAERHSGRAQAGLGSPLLRQESETPARGLVRSQGWPLRQGWRQRRRRTRRWRTRRKLNRTDRSEVAWSFSRSRFHPNSWGRLHQKS